MTRPLKTPALTRDQVPSFTGFAQERETYERLKPDLIARAEGQYIVIQDDVADGPLESYDEALRVGYRRFGLDRAFLVQQILAAEPVAVVTRDVVPCPA